MSASSAASALRSQSIIAPGLHYTASATSLHADRSVPQSTLYCTVPQVADFVNPPSIYREITARQYR